VRPTCSVSPVSLRFAAFGLQIRLQVRALTWRVGSSPSTGPKERFSRRPRFIAHSDEIRREGSTLHCSPGRGWVAAGAVTLGFRFQPPPVEPCMRFSSTRLTDVFHRLCSAGPATRRWALGLEATELQKQYLLACS
jgi:hypothetical protein